MKKHLLSILFLAVAGLIWWASFSSTVRNPYVDNKNPIVVVSGYVPYTLTKQLAGNTVNLIMLLPPGAEPHAFEPTPGVLVSLKQARAFIYVSNELEPWARDLAQTADTKAQVLVLASVLPTSTDPHVWMNVQNVEKLAEEIEKLLVQINPGEQLLYSGNLQQLKQELNALDRDFQTGLANCHSREVVHVGHLAFKNLTDRYGLTLTALSGTSHEGEHSAKKLAELVGQIKDKNIQDIFTEESLSSRLADTVAQETGTQILPLYPIEHISKKDFNDNVTYTQLMRRNLESLTRGLKCQAS